MRLAFSTELATVHQSPERETMATPALTENSVFGSCPAFFDSLTIADTTDVRPSSNVQKIVATPGGSVDPSLIAEVMREPAVDVSALNIRNVLAGVSITDGLKIATLAKMQYQLRDDGGTFQGAGTHVTLTTAKGFLAVDSINAKQDDQDGAKIAMKFWALATGSNPPLIVNIGQNIAGTPLVDALFKLGPVTFEGAALGGVQSVMIKPGIEYKPFRAGGQVYATEGFIRKRRPTIEIETTNVAILNSIGMGLVAISSGTTIGLLSMGHDLADAVHVLIGMSAGTYEITDAGVSGEGDAMAKITITGAGAVMTAATEQALD
jgi:hypothetical protein